MKKILNTVLPLFFVFIASSFVILSTNWNLEPNYVIHFSGSKVEGTISGLKGKVNFDPKDLKNALIDVEVDATSIKTGNELKDKHAKNSDWLDVANYPKIKFKSSSFKSVSNAYAVVGDLEIHGTVKSIVIPFRFTSIDGSGLFEGQFNIDRKEFGVKGNLMASMMSSKIQIELKIPVKE